MQYIHPEPVLKGRFRLGSPGMRGGCLSFYISNRSNRFSTDHTLNSETVEMRCGKCCGSLERGRGDQEKQVQRYSGIVR